MSTLKRIKINYNFRAPDEITRKKGQLQFVSSGVQLYFNCQHLLCKLSKDARAFYDYICEEMDLENQITIDAAFKLAFKEHYFRITGKRVKETSLPTYVSKLNTLGLIILAGGSRSAFYYINPKYAFKGSKGDRKKLITKLINTRGTIGLSLFGLIDEPETEFLSVVNPE